jgi:hypothetical protein
MHSNRRTTARITRYNDKHHNNRRLSGTVKPPTVRREAVTAKAKVGANKSHTVTANGFALQSVERIPFSARPRAEARVSWLDTECGGLAELCGATRLFETDSNAVIAEVKDQAYLIPFGEGDRVPLAKGIWSVCPPE